jgi:outer membrane protein assembly factor BamD (BamD/ComL family)
MITTEWWYNDIVPAESYLLKERIMTFKCIRPLTLLFIVICFFAITACTGNEAEELFKTAQFEELQNNREHARQLYENIIKNYPQSEYARKAEISLSEMEKSGNGNKK